MSMIKCPKCGRNISSLIKTCPECGHLLQLDESSATPMPDMLQPAPAKRRLTLGVSLLACVAILIGGYFYLTSHAAQQRETRAYALLQDCKDPLVFEDFIAKYPESEHLEEVRKRYLTLNQEQAKWEALVLRGTREELQTFIQSNSGSPYLRVALARIDSMDWQMANTRPTIQSMEQYIAVHPEGFFIEQAEIQRQRLERERLAAEERAQQDTMAVSVDSLAV